MAITYSSGAGTIVTTSAKNGTVKSFTGGKVRLEDPITTGNNGNLELSPTYVGRLIYIDGGTGVGQKRYITGQTTGQGDGDDVDLDVSEDWDTNPDNTSTYQISYIMEDVATLGGYAYITRTGFYEEKNILTVGSGGGTFAFLFVPGTSLVEMNDHSSTTVGSWTVENGGHLGVGYDLGGTPVDGGFLLGLNALDGELMLDCKVGSVTNFHSCLFQGAKANNSTELDGGTHIWSSTKLASMSYQMLLNGVTADDLTIAGAGTTNDTVRVEDNDTINSIIMLATYGFESLDDTLTETLEVRNCTFVNGAGRDVRVHDDKKWDFVNPVGIGGDSTAISFETDDLNEVNILFSLDIVVTTPQGVPIEEAQCYVYEGLLNQDLPAANRVDTDSNGEVSTDVLVTKYTYPSSVFTTTTSGDHALKAYKWLMQPFVTTLAPDFSITGGLSVGIPLLPDSNIVEQDQATAISDGSGITVNHETQPGTLIAFTAGSGSPTLAVGDTLTGATSGASGVVVSYEEGDATAGKIFLKTRNSTEFTPAGETLNRTGGGWSATYTAGSAQDFSWYVDCDTKSVQTVYDYLAAKMASDTPDSIIYDAIEWGEEQQTQLLYSGAGGFFSERSLIETLQTDDCDAITGWSAGTDSAVSLNSSEYQQGDGALNLYKSGTSGSICSMSKTTTSRDFTSFVGFWLYIKDTTTLNKLATSNAIELRFGNDSSNYYYQRWDKADVDVGWNFLNFKSEGASSSGSPSTTACDFTDIRYTVTGPAQTTVAGDVIVDDFKVYDPEGVFFADRGSGTVGYMTADDGSTYVPPASVTVTITVKDKDGAVANASVYVQLSSGPFNDTDHIIRAFTNASGVATGPYTYTGDVSVVVHVRKQSSGDTRYEEFDGSGTITASGMDTLVTLAESTIQE